MLCEVLGGVPSPNEEAKTESLSLIAAFLSDKFIDVSSEMSVVSYN